MFVVTPRGEQECGSGVYVHVRSSGNTFSHAELVAFIEYTSPASQRKHVAAVVHLLQKVPGSQCVVRLGGELRVPALQGTSAVSDEGANVVACSHDVRKRRSRSDETTVFCF